MTEFRFSKSVLNGHLTLDMATNFIQFCVKLSILQSAFTVIGFSYSKESLFLKFVSNLKNAHLQNLPYLKKNSFESQVYTKIRLPKDRRLFLPKAFG